MRAMLGRGSGSNSLVVRVENPGQIAELDRWIRTCKQIPRGVKSRSAD